MENSEYAKDIRTVTRHENELIHHRINWMTTCNGLLFTAFGLVWGRPEAIGSSGRDCARPPSHTTGRAVFRIRRLNSAAEGRKIRWH